MWRMRDRTYTTEEVVRRGHEIYDREIRARLEASHQGLFVVVDVTTGNWEIDEDDVAASDRPSSRIRTRSSTSPGWGIPRHTAWAGGRAPARVFVGGAQTVRGTVTSDGREALLSIEVLSADGAP